MQATTVQSLLRTSQALCGQMCQKETLENGIAYFHERFDQIYDLNQFREVVLTEQVGVEKVVKEVEQWFAEKNLTCLRWALAAETESPELAEYLTSHGFQERVESAMLLTQWKSLDATNDLRVLPARAVRAAYRQTIMDDDATVSQSLREMKADAYAERLDDPQYDAFVAMAGQKPVGRCALYQVGDIARVVDLTSTSDDSCESVYASLLTHVLTLAKRLAMRCTCAAVNIDDSVKLRLLTDFGFESDGRIVEYERPSKAANGQA